MPTSVWAHACGGLVGARGETTVGAGREEAEWWGGWLRDEAKMRRRRGRPASKAGPCGRNTEPTGTGREVSVFTLGKTWAYCNRRLRRECSITPTGIMAAVLIAFLDKDGIRETRCLVMLSDNGASKRGWSRSLASSTHEAPHNNFRPSLIGKAARLDDLGGPGRITHFQFLPWRADGD